MLADAVLVSDVHVDGPECARQAAFLRFLGGFSRTSPPVLCLLGDVFHTWWHHGDVPMPQYRPVIDALRDFPLCFVAGNHDFHAPAFFGARGARVPPNDSAIGSSLTLTLGSLSSVVTHGDQVDTSPGYRGLHALLRSGGFATAMRALPASGQWQLLQKLAGHAKGSPSVVAVARQHTLAARLSTGHGLVAMGHTHAPELVRHPSYIFLNTGDWVEHRTYATVTRGDVELSRFDG